MLKEVLWHVGPTCKNMKESQWDHPVDDETVSGPFPFKWWPRTIK